MAHIVHTPGPRVYRIFCQTSPLTKLSLLKELRMNQVGCLFLSECYKLRLTGHDVLEITDLRWLDVLKKRWECPTAGFSQLNFSQHSCAQQPSKPGSNQNPLSPPEVLTGRLLLFCMSTSACVIQPLAPIQVSRGCQSLEKSPFQQVS